MKRGAAQPTGGHLRTLTSLRFFAAAAVLLLHLGQTVLLDAREVFALGHVGVTFFFVLSGFVLTWTHREGDGAANFYGRRLARVWPLHALTTLAALALLLSAASSVPWRDLPLVLTLTHAFVPGAYYDFNSVSWTLGCEAFFYALFPLLVVWAGRVRRPERAAVGVVVAQGVALAVAVGASGMVESATGVSARGLTGYVLNISPPYRLFEFVVGVLLGVAVRRGWRCSVSLRWAVGAVVVSAGALYAQGGASGGMLETPIYVQAFLMLPSLALLVASAASSDLASNGGVLTSAPMVRLGRASFALYLVHWLTLTVIADHASGPVWALAGVAVVVTLVLADVAHHWFEAPIERALRRRLGARRRVADSADDEPVCAV